MLHVFYGEDQFRAWEALQAVRARLDSDGNLANSTVRLEARGLSAGDLRAACHVASFFAENRLVVVDGLQARFSGARRRGARRPRAGATADAASELDQFVDVLANLPETTTVVLMDERPATAFLAALPQTAEVREFHPLRTDDLRTWAAERVRRQNARIEPRALERLVNLIDGHHLGELAQEIDKLIAYAGERPISTDDVEELVSGAMQYQFWDLTDAVIAGRAERALGVLQAMDERDQPPQLLLFMLTRQYRQLIVAQAMLREGASQSQIGAQLGISSPFPLRKAIEQAGRYPANRLEAAYRRLLETDVAIKTGVLDVRVALELLIVDLTELARAPSRSQQRVRS